MKNNIKLFIYDIKNITKDKKSFFVICFFTFLTIFIGVTISIFFKDNNKSLFNEIKIISNIDRADVFTLYITYIFSFVLFSTYPFLTGIVIIIPFLFFPPASPTKGPPRLWKERPGHRSISDSPSPGNAGTDSSLPGQRGRPPGHPHSGAEGILQCPPAGSRYTARYLYPAVPGVPV